MELELARQLSVTSESKILLLVMDGLGGLPHPETGRTELGTAQTPNPDALAARGNFCTVDSKGRVADRRAGRITSERCGELCTELRQIALKGVEVFVEPVREHRFVLVLRGEGLSDAIGDTDPQQVGAEAPAPPATALEGEATAQLVARFVEEARRVLADPSTGSGQAGPAHMLLLRGVAGGPGRPL